MSATQKVIDLLSQVGKTLQLRTPDKARGATFEASLQNGKVTFLVGTRSTVEIDPQVFEAVCGYLNERRVEGQPVIRINSSTTLSQAGPLCLLARKYSNNTRSINYVLPLMAAASLVKLDGGRPNKVSLV